MSTKDTNTLYVPSDLNLGSCSRFSTNLISKLKAGEKVSINFDRMSWAPPYGLGYISVMLRKLQLSRFKEQISFQDIGNRNGYARHMGFYDAALNEAISPNSDPLRYIGVTELDCITIQKKAHEYGENAGVQLEEFASEIADVMLSDTSGEERRHFGYCMREMLRNCMDHARADKIFYVAQRYPQKGYIECAVFDTGRGLKKSLTNNPFLDIDSMRDALKCSLLPGVSGRTYKGVKIRHEDPWQNAGYGLYLTHRICRNTGAFAIVSRTTGVALTKSKHKYFRSYFPGTAVLMRLNISDINSYGKKVSAYNRQGEALRKRIKGTVGGGFSASKLSRMIADDFEGQT